MSRRPPTTATPAAWADVAATVLVSGAALAVALTLVPLALLRLAALLFTEPAPIGTVAAVAIAAHVAAYLWRRARFSLFTSFLLQLAAGIAVLTATLYRSEAIAWVIPNSAVLETARSDIADAFGPFREVVAPIPYHTGFAVVAGAVLWLLAWFADTATFRGHAPAQAIVPYAGLAVFIAIMWDSPTPTAERLAVPVAIAGFLVIARGRRIAADYWFDPHPPHVRATPLFNGLALGTAAVAVGLVAGAALPGVIRNDPLVNLRDAGRGSGPRTTTSPFVDVGQLLGRQSDLELFTVTATRPHYWRLTALERFNGRIWGSAGRTYREIGTDEQLGDTAQPTENIEVAVTRLGNIWVPGAAQPVEVSAPVDLKYDDDTGSLIVAEGDHVPAGEYQFTIAADTSGSPLPDDLSDYRDLPLSENADQLLATFIRNTFRDGIPQDPLERLRRLQDEFHTTGFVYDIAADYSASADLTADFLVRRTGFCVQFASTFALAARQMGFPTRLATGFTYGEATPTDDGRTRFAVSGRYAHAWPEVWVSPAVGWVAFEPTPGRGNPDATEVTGIAPAQAADEDPNATEPATTTTAVDPTTTTAATPTTESITEPAPPTDAASPMSTGRGWLAAGLLIALVVAGLASRLWWIRRRRRTNGFPSWSEITRLAPTRRAAHRIDDTVRGDVGLRAIGAGTNPGPGDGAADHDTDRYAVLAHLETKRRWADAPLDEAEHRALADASTAVYADLIDRSDRSTRLAQYIGRPIRATVLTERTQPSERTERTIEAAVRPPASSDVEAGAANGS